MEKVKNNVMAAILCAIMVGMLLIPGVNAKASTTQIPEGYTPIYTVEDLYGINNDLSGNYILMNDIDLSETKQGGDWDTGNGWMPIGTDFSDVWDADDFSGIFDGNGYRIKNMTIYGNCSIRYVGLFGFVSGTVRNLGMVDVDVDIETPVDGNNDYYCRYGSIAGYDYGVIEACYVTGNIKINGANGVGGISGTGYGDIKNCYSDVDIVVGKGTEYCGGIAGYSGDISNCYTLGTVAGAEYNGAVVGSGYSTGCCYTGSLTDDYAKKLTQTQMKSEKCYTGFDFKNTWVLDKNSSCPYPQLRNCMQVRTESIELLSVPDKTSYYTTDKLDLTGSSLKINYEDAYTVTVPLTESMLTYKMTEGTQSVNINYNGCTAQFDIEVEKAPESLNVTAKKAKLIVGDTYTYKVKYIGNGKVTFSSSNSSILRIDKTTGKATAKKAGNVIITVKAGELSKQILVEVEKVPESLKITAKKTKLKVGASYTYKVKYTGTGKVTFSSSNSKKMKINKTTGKATAKKVGTVTITIKGGNLSKKITVKVVK